jgi:putative tricarboxylic transport membrane protein
VRDGDLAFGGATLVIGVAYYFMATSVPVSQLADAIGPQGLPKVYALMLVALSLILIVTGLRGVRSSLGSPQRSEVRERPASRGLLRAIGMLAIGVAYIVVVPWLGYLLAISMLIVATTYYQGGTIGRKSAVVALCGGVFFWLLFVVLMGIAQPPGFFPPQR